MTIEETFNYLKDISDFSNIKLVCTKEIPRIYSGYFIEHDKKYCIRCCKDRPCEYVGIQEWYKTGYLSIIVGKELIIDYMDNTCMRLLDVFEDHTSGKELIGTWDIDIKRNEIGEFEVVGRS